MRRVSTAIWGNRGIGFARHSLIGIRPEIGFERGDVAG